MRKAMIRAMIGVMIGVMIGPIIMALEKPLKFELDKPMKFELDKLKFEWPDMLPPVDKPLAHINGDMIGTPAEAAEGNERFCCPTRRAPKSHPRAVRQHDLWSHGWQMNVYTLFIINEITSSSILHETLFLVSLFCILQIFLIRFLRRINFASCCCAIKRVLKRHLRALRQHDWHIRALRIGSLTLQLLAEEFCPGKKAGSWMRILIGFLTLQLLAEDFCRAKKAMWIDRGSGVVFAEKVISSLSSSASRVLYKGSVERNNYSRSRPPQKLELVKIVDKLLAKLWAHIGNGRTELKAYKKSRITHPGKHGHNVGSTAFRNWPQGGDGSGEELTIQDDWGSPDTTVNSSVQMTSPPPKTTPQTPPTPPPLQTPRATPQGQPPTPASQVQPPTPTPTPQVQPPTPQVQPQTPTPAPPPPPPPPPRGWFNFNFGGWFNFKVAGLAKIFLTISATLVLAPPQIVLSGGNSLSPNDKTLLFGTKLLGLGGFIFCLLAYIVRQDNTAAKLLIALGVLANVFGLLLLVALGK